MNLLLSHWVFKGVHNRVYTSCARALTKKKTIVQFVFWRGASRLAFHVFHGQEETIRNHGVAKMKICDWKFDQQAYFTAFLLPFLVMAFLFDLPSLFELHSWLLHDGQTVQTFLCRGPLIGIRMPCTRQERTELPSSHWRSKSWTRLFT